MTSFVMTSYSLCIRYIYKFNLPDFFNKASFYISPRLRKVGQCVILLKVCADFISWRKRYYLGDIPVLRIYFYYVTKLYWWLSVLFIVFLLCYICHKWHCRSNKVPFANFSHVYLHCKQNSDMSQVYLGRFQVNIGSFKY